MFLRRGVWEVWRGRVDDFLLFDCAPCGRGALGVGGNQRGVWGVVPWA